MRTLMTVLGAASIGAAGMYLMDPDRGQRRRAQLRDALAEVDAAELVERTRQLEPVRTVRELGGGMSAMLEPGRWMSGSRASRWMPGSRAAGWMTVSRAPALMAVSQALGWRRRRSFLAGRDWMMLGGLVGAIAAGLWLARRWTDTSEGVEVVRTMTVDAPLARVYEFWNDFENFPRFMSHVREIRRVGPDRTHWVVAGPGGTPIEWDAIVSRRVPNEEISWHTVDGSLVEHSGTVRFRPLGPDRTQVEVRMTYRPVGGVLGHGVATLLGSDPERVIADDLSRLSAQLHGGRPAVGESGQRR